MIITEVLFSEVCTKDLMAGALIHDVHPGFKEDYLVIHCLLKIYKPKRIFEVGTNIGSGINVMKKASPDSEIFSLDLDYETMMHDSKQYPIGPNGEDRVGSGANVPYTQLRGNSLTFDYSKYYPINAWFIDGEHDYEHPKHEAAEAIKSGAELIIFHDADMVPVYNGLMYSFSEIPNPYALARVVDTRILFAIKK